MRAVPHLTTVVGYGCAVANLVIAGLGTLISAFYEPYVNKTQVLVGITQFLLSPYIIGYLWSIYWSYLIVMKVGKKGKDTAPLVAPGTANSEKVRF